MKKLTKQEMIFQKALGTWPPNITGYGGYEGLLEKCTGAKVVVSEDVGDYQGDILMLLRTQDDKYGYASAGYGSCSGCDSLQACEDDGMKAVRELGMSMAKGVKWFNTLEDAKKYIIGKDWQGTHFYHIDDGHSTDGFKQKVKDYQ